MAPLGERLFHALTEQQIRLEAKPELRTEWRRALAEIRALPEVQR